ncbi:MAG: hypothetical protein ACPG32_08755, partial [Akkermansiaceae bacterium]
QSGTVQLQSPELAKFLRADSTGKASFILAVDHFVNHDKSRVHAFASSKHPQAGGPSLQVILTKP